MRKFMLLVGVVMILTLALGAAASAQSGGVNEISGTDNSEVLRGTPANDNITGNLGNDIIFGLAGNDTLLGGTVFVNEPPNKDILFGGSGNDVLNGGSGKDLLFGGSGNDLFFSNEDRGAPDILNCGGGFDRYSADANDLVLSNCEQPLPPGQGYPLDRATPWTGLATGYGAAGG